MIGEPKKIFFLFPPSLSLCHLVKIIAGNSEIFRFQWVHTTRCLRSRNCKMPFLSLLTLISFFFCVPNCSTLAGSDNTACTANLFLYTNTVDTLGSISLSLSPPVRKGPALALSPIQGIFSARSMPSFGWHGLYKKLRPSCWICLPNES